MTNRDVILQFTPKLIPIRGVDALKSPLQKENLVVYGEIHGIRENADVIYSLVHQLDITQLAIENSPTVAEFIRSASKGVYDFSLIDSDTFDTSILSIEVAKTIATLLSEDKIEHIEYVDTYFDALDPTRIDHSSSPQDREQKLADNILAIDRSAPTLCLLGQWHTQVNPTAMADGDTHYSALHRIRETLPDVPFVHNIYGGGTAFNDNRILHLPDRQNAADTYSVDKISARDFDLHVPIGHHSLLQI